MRRRFAVYSDTIVIVSDDDGKTWKAFCTVTRDTASIVAAALDQMEHKIVGTFVAELDQVEGLE